MFCVLEQITKSGERRPYCSRPAIYKTIQEAQRYKDWCLSKSMDRDSIYDEKTVYRICRLVDVEDGAVL